MEETPPSERQLLAERLAAYCREHRLAELYGGDVRKVGRHYTVAISRHGGVEGVIRVYGETFIQVRFTYVQMLCNYVFESEAFVLEFLSHFFLSGDWEAAGRVPTKPKKSPMEAPREDPSPS